MFTSCWTTPRRTRPVDPALAHPPPKVHAALHADLQLVAEPRRTLVRRTDDEVDQTRRTRSVRDLVASLRTWITNWNEDPKPHFRHKTADEILDSLANYCLRINDSGH